MAKVMEQYLTGGNATGEREVNDFYRTPEWATKALLEREEFSGLIWEPACGDGAIAKLLPAGSMASDLIGRGYGEAPVDFLESWRLADHVITNPPYKLAQAFVEHALRCATGKVAMLLKLNFLEGQARYRFFKEHPPKVVHVFSRRLSFDKGDEPGKGNGLLAYAWYVWDHSYTGPTMVDWIP